MGNLSNEMKEAIVLKTINRGSKTMKSIALENNVGLSTLERWLANYRKNKPLSYKFSQNKSPKDLSQSEKFNHVLDTHKLDEVSLGQYCRKHGLYSHQLMEWKKLFMKSPDSNKTKQNQSELKQLKAENKKLQRELTRKEKALAEASALLIMKKKADLIWGENEEN